VSKELHSAGVRHLSAGKLRRADTSLEAGRLGKIDVVGDQVRLGAPFVFDNNNIDQFSF